MPNKADYLLISFPKCGRTWLRLILGRILQNYFGLQSENLLDLVALAKLDPEIPQITVVHDDKPQWKKARDLATSKTRYRDNKIIFLVRDPRDVVVSSFFQKVKRRQAYHGSLSEYIYEEVGSFESIIKFYNIWADNAHVPQEFLLVRYEDIHKNAKYEIRKIVDFLGLSKISEDLLSEAVNFASFENMRKMEEEDIFKVKPLRPTNPADPESYKTRRGKVGGFIDYLSTAEIDYLTQRMSKTLSTFYGYPCA